MDNSHVDDAGAESEPLRPGESTARVSDLVSGARAIRVCRYCTDPECENPVFCESYELVSDDATIRTVHIGGMEDVNMPVKDMWGNALFSKHTLLEIDIEGVSSSFVLHPTERLVMGRMDPQFAPEHFLDLTPYQAHIKGVSRQHAAISQMGHTLMLTDLGSTNGTYLNEQRLVPNQPRILRDGDMIRLGHLVMYARFKQ